MELVVLNIGLELGVISRTLFAMMVLMALITTWMTSPLLALVLRRAPALTEGRELTFLRGFAETAAGRAVN